MNWSVIFRVSGILVTLFSTVNLPVILVAWLYDEPEAILFFYAFLINLLAGFLLWFPFRYSQQALKPREGFLITVLFWVILGTLGAIPLVFASWPNLSITDAVFESISGLTTTGATVLTGIEYLPKSILFYRQQLHWLGGMGIVVLAVAVLPLLGVGAMQLYRTEAPGPNKDQKITPRIAESAKKLWYIYLTLTFTCASGYWLAGMNVFDAITHSFATVSTGGFANYDSSIGWYDNAMIEAISIVFMLLSSISFTLHYLSWRNKTFSNYLVDTETRSFLLILAGAACLTVPFLLVYGLYDIDESIRFGIFQIVSIATTTGFSVTDFSVWPLFLPFMLFLLGFFGGCAGSTAGGMKVIRIVLMFKQGSRELKRLIHPNGVFTIKVNQKPVNERITQAVWGFFAAYMFLFVIMCILLLALGLDMVTVFSVITSCVNNLGPALGEATSHYQTLPDAAKWVLCFAMLLGRLEIFTLLVLLTPMYWRH